MNTSHEPTPSTPGAALLRDLLLVNLIPDYADGVLDADPEARAQVEQLLRESEEARAFLADYQAAHRAVTETELNTVTARLFGERGIAPAAAAPGATQTLPILNRAPASQILRQRSWLGPFRLGKFPLFPSKAFALNRAATSPPGRILDLGQFGVSEEQRCRLLPWASQRLQITQKPTTTGVKYFAYIEPSGDLRPNGVLLVRLRSADGATGEARLTKGSPKTHFKALDLPADLDALEIEVAIE